MSASLVGSEMCIRDSFFKQKTAYEMSASLVGSEMCIRDSLRKHMINIKNPKNEYVICLLYTSDAADD
ncbi:hypothetical protein JMUB7546_26900 [Staphylococcus aureus]